jgi:hypothetical protein
MFMVVYTGIDTNKCRHIATLPISDSVMVALWFTNFYMVWHSTPYQETVESKAKKDDKKSARKRKSQADVELGDVQKNPITV